MLSSQGVVEHLGGASLEEGSLEVSPPVLSGHSPLSDYGFSVTALLLCLLHPDELSTLSFRALMRAASLRLFLVGYFITAMRKVANTACASPRCVDPARL